MWKLSIKYEPRNVYCEDFRENCVSINFRFFSSRWPKCHFESGMKIGFVIMTWLKLFTWESIFIPWGQPQCRCTEIPLRCESGTREVVGIDRVTGKQKWLQSPLRFAHGILLAAKIHHCSDSTALRHFILLNIQLFVQQFIRLTLKNSANLHSDPLCWESTGNQWISCTMSQ